ncbi:MAG: hypothetical protein IEMM0002_0965 [bacterium]|nr:MAG: hypothetical protein IEMM0002_0965 [bacterium]
MEFSRIINNIKLLRNIKTDFEVAELLGMSQSAFSERKRRKSLPYDEIIRFCGKEKISLDSIISAGTGDRREDGKNRRSRMAAQEIAAWHVVRPAPDETEILKPFVVPSTFPGAKEGGLVSIKMKSNDFVPVCEKGDLLVINTLIDKNNPVERKNYVLKEETLFSIAYAQYDGAGQAYLVSYDPAKEPRPAGDCNIIGIVVGLWREFNEQ